MNSALYCSFSVMKNVSEINCFFAQKSGVGYAGFFYWQDNNIRAVLVHRLLRPL